MTTRALTSLLSGLPATVSTARKLGITDIGKLAPGPNYALIANAPAGDIAFQYVDPASFTTPSLTQGLLNFAVQGISNLVSPGSGVRSLATQALQSGRQIPSSEPVTLVKGGSPMGFAEGDSGFFGGTDILGGINSVLQGGLGQSLLGIGTQALSGYVQQQFAPQPVSFNPAMMAAVPAIATGARAVATVGRSFFNRFPNLATAIQSMRNQGKQVTRANLYGLLKRFGPDFLITGGILTAAAVSELAVAGAGRRRMNVGNVKALRRAHRRMKSFHHVCQVNDHLLGSRRRAPKHKGAAVGTSVVSVK